jgi:hypothetical protein
MLICETYLTVPDVTQVLYSIYLYYLALIKLGTMPRHHIPILSVLGGFIGFEVQRFDERKQ